MKKQSVFFVALAIFLGSLVGCQNKGTEQQAENTTDSTKVAAQEVNVYSHRHYPVDQQLYDEFTKQTGIKVNVVQAKAAELLARLEQEGASSPADLLITVDAGALYLIKQKGLFQAINSETLAQNVPSYLKDTENQWFGLTQRARVIVYNKEKVKPSQITSYEDLTKPQWKGKVLIRSSENIYNQSLLAAMIHHEGAEKAKQWASGIVKNMAREPKGGDKDQVLALAAGEGDVAIVNTYYLGQMANSKEEAEKKAFDKIGVIFPNQAKYGTHTNISGAGVCKYAPHKDNAVKLIEFLSSEQAQKVYAEGNQEYPIRAGVPYSATLESFGKFKADTLDLSILGKFNAEAVKVFDEAKWK